MAIGCGPGDFRPCCALVRDVYRGFMSQIRQEAAKPPAAPTRGPRPAGRRVGYLVAVVVNAALLFVLNGHPGWQEVLFLTSATSQVLGRSISRWPSVWPSTWYTWPTTRRG
jgi:hypothetical protein